MAASEEPMNIMSNILKEILNVLRGSTIVEAHGKDVKIKFWTTYKKVSNDYDDDFLERAHGDIGIILTFAGLLSAVVSTFIGIMQPNTGDTTNELLLQLIKITAGSPNAVNDIGTLTSITRYSSSTAWIQTLAYISLALSILAAFGAVVGKQCLYSYEAARKKGGSLEESGTRRQMRLDRLEYLQLRTWLQAFLVLLQVALLLFSVSLCIKTWTDHLLPTFGFMVCTVVSVALFYASTIILSVWWQDSPVQTPGTSLVRAICEKIRGSSSNPNMIDKLKLSAIPAIHWILETSTNPEAVEAAMAMIPLTQWLPDLDVSASFKRLRENFEACRGKEELYVKYGQAMAHLCVQSVKIDTELLDNSFWDDEFQSTQSRFIRDAFMDCREAFAAYNRLNDRGTLAPEETANWLKHQASARTALRTMVVHGRPHRLSRPDDENLIWNSNLCWSYSDGRKPVPEEFDWLVDYLADIIEHDRDDGTLAGDALLVLSGMRGLGSSVKQSSYITSIIRCTGSKYPRIQHAALRAICEAKEELIPSYSMPQVIDTKLVDELSRSFVPAVRPNYNSVLDESGDLNYINLIYGLTKHKEWCQRLAFDGNLQQCISLIDTVREYDRSVGFYLTVIIGRIHPTGKDLPSVSNADLGRPWRLLIRNTWLHARSSISHDSISHDDYIDGIPVLVSVTTLLRPDRSIPWSENPTEDPTKGVHEALGDLRERRADFVKNGVDQDAVDGAISSMQELYNNLSPKT